MSSTDFFQEVEHTPVPWRQYQLHCPLFYTDFMFMTVSVLVSTEKIRSILPSSRMKPYRIIPGRSVLNITAYQYRDCDIGPYNEVSIAVPLTIDQETPMFTGILRKSPKMPMTYTRYLPVTTEIAREVGAEFAGYPKFVADISFSDENGWVECSLVADNQHVLTFKGRKLDLTRVPRYRISPITFRNAYILRSEFVIDEREMGLSKKKEDVRLELGDHPIAQELGSMQLGKTISYAYCPQARGILTPVFESLAG